GGLANIRHGARGYGRAAGGVQPPPTTRTATRPRPRTAIEGPPRPGRRLRGPPQPGRRFERVATTRTVTTGPCGGTGRAGRPVALAGVGNPFPPPCRPPHPRLRP